MDEHAQLAELCRRLGAKPEQADAMAGQLLKRADQLADERRQTQAEAMAYLLRLVVEGRGGEIPKELHPPAAGGERSK
jgi:hypothetical protein